MCLSNIGTGTKYVLQILVPEQNVSFKYWYRNKMCPSNIGTGTKIYIRYEKDRLMGTIQNLYERFSWHFKLILTLVTSRFENTPHQFGPYKDHLSENAVAYKNKDNMTHLKSMPQLWRLNTG